MSHNPSIRGNHPWTSWFSWGITTTFVLVQFFLQASAGVVAKKWQIDFHLTPTQLGTLTSAFYISYVGMQIPVGYCYDRFRARTVLCWSSGLLCVGILCLSLSQVFWQAFLSRILMGVGSSFGFVGMLYVTSSWFSSHRFALLVGVAETLGMIGVALVEVIMGWIITHYDWRTMMLISGLIMAGVHLLIICFVYDREVTKVRNPISLLSAIKYVMSSKQVWWAGVYGFAMFSIINVLVALWGIPFLRYSYPALNLQSASIMMALVFVGAGIGAPLNGWLNRYAENKYPQLTVSAAITLLLFTIIINVPHLQISTLGMLLFAIGVSSSSYVQVFALIREGVDKPFQATALAATNMILMSSAPFLQPLVGKLLDMQFSYAQSLSVIEVVLLMAFFLSLYSSKLNKSASIIAQVKKK